MLAEQYRPKQWAEVVSQDKELAALERLRQRGKLSGRAYWLSGKSGTGKTTIARLIAREVADDYAIQELDGGQVDAALLDAIERDMRHRPFGLGHCYIINEAHGLRSSAIRASVGRGSRPLHAVPLP